MKAEKTTLVTATVVASTTLSVRFHTIYLAKKNVMNAATANKPMYCKLDTR
jgi:hypothetical protein